MRKERKIMSVKTEKSKRGKLWFILGHSLVFLACIALSVVIWLVVHFTQSDSSDSQGDTALLPDLSISETVA